MAVVRLKRRLDENPVEAIYFASKRLKSEETEDIVPALFKFSATVDSKDGDSSAAACVNRVLQNEHAKVKSVDDKTRAKKISNITDKIRKENQLNSKENRYQVINRFRNIKPEDTLSEIDGEITPLTVIDIVNHEKTVEEMREEEYVYDLYYTEMKSDINELLDEANYRILTVQNELYQEGAESEESDHGDDDDDSNEENNYRNDYPDEDEVYDEDEQRSNGSDDDYHDEIYNYEEDPDVSGITNDFIGRCKLAGSEDDDDLGSEELSTDDDVDVYDDDLVLQHKSFGSYMKKKNRAENKYAYDIDDEDD